MIFELDKNEVNELVEMTAKRLAVEEKQRKLMLLALEVIFILILTAVWLLGGGEDKIASAGTLQFVLLSLGTMRLAHAISYNTIGEPIRGRFTKVEHDSSGAGDNVEPDGVGWVRAIGELLACPICSGQWAALGLLTVWALLPDGFGTLVLWAFGAAGAAELIHYAKEAMEWRGRNDREQAGALNRAAKTDDNIGRIMQWVK